MDRVYLDISLLSDPTFLRADIATPEVIRLLEPAVKKMAENTCDGLLFSSLEFNKLNRIGHWLARAPVCPDQKLDRVDFFRFVKEYDRRRKTNFIETFPELATFLEHCSVPTPELSL